MNKIISISGPSGVGKTTISNLIMSVLDAGSTTIISGDDAHRWERGNDNWKKFTHLNPAANNIEQDFKQLLDLKNNKQIKRRHYNHNTGMFDSPEIIIPKKNIIYEGLHGLYLKEIRGLSDIKIYVDTDEDLKIAWKMKRDMEKRGYTEEQVMIAIQRRHDDEQKYIVPQKKYADAVVKFTFCGTEVGFNFETSNKECEKLLEKVKTFYYLKKEFIKTCISLSQDQNLVQNKGGNVSFKYEDKIIITSSGVELNKVSIFDGSCIVSLRDKNELIFKNGRPSLELDSHINLKNSVVHAHPKNLLVLLCSNEARQKIKDLFSMFKYDYIEYVAPGAELAQRMKTCKEEIIFCENHGVFISSENLENCFDLLKKIDKIAKDSLVETGLQLECPGHLFPDSAVLQKKNKSFNNLLYSIIVSNNMTAKLLNNEQVEKLLNMEGEKYRSGV